MAKIYLTPNTSKLFKQIRNKKTRLKIKTALAKVSQDPYLGKKLRGELEGQFSLKIWPYRIIYFITPKQDVIVTDIGHRKEIYR
jgi:mRNA interferase RelE/StbE